MTSATNCSTMTTSKSQQQQQQHEPREQTSCGGGEHNCDGNNYPLAHVALRPSTQQRLASRGFITVGEVMQAASFGHRLSQLAAELACSVPQAAELWREIVQQVSNSVTGGDTRRLQDPVPPTRKNLKQQARPDDQRPNPFRRPLAPLRASEILRQQLGNNNNNNSNNSILSATPAAIITFSRAVDQLLGGSGIPVGQVTELAGAPGTGKTQWAMQVAVNAALPLALGGVQGGAVYIDTEGSFSAERCMTMATALIRHVQEGLKRRRRRQKGDRRSSQPEAQTIPEWNVTPQDILCNIHVFRVHDETTLQAVLDGSLPALIDSCSLSSVPSVPSESCGPSVPRLPIKLLVLDSVAFPFRASSLPTPAMLVSIQDDRDPAFSSASSDYAFRIERARRISALATTISTLAAQRCLAVLAINQMTTKWGANRNSSNTNNSIAGTMIGSAESTFVPALGDSWAHAVTTRICLTTSTSSYSFHPQQQHQQQPTAFVQRCTCHLVKSPCLPTGSADFLIVEEGIRGVEYKCVPITDESTATSRRMRNNYTDTKSTTTISNDGNDQLSKKSRML